MDVLDAVQVPAPDKPVRGRPFVKGDDPRRNRKGQPKMGKVKQLMRDLASAIMHDPFVQGRLMQMARDGTLHPQLYREFIHRLGGKVPSNVEVVVRDRRDDPTEAERRRRILAMPKQDRLQLAELIMRANNGPAALPPAAAVAEVTQLKTVAVPTRRRRRRPYVAPDAPQGRPIVLAPPNDAV